MRKSQQLIVKVQAALISTQGPKQVLIYDRTKKHVWQGEHPEIFDHIRNLVTKGELPTHKGYFEATLRDDSRIEVDLTKRPLSILPW